MAGRSDRRQSGLPPGSKSAAPAAPSSSCRTSREGAIEQTSAAKMCDPTICAPSSTSVPQGWADLPRGVLESIIVLLRSPHETLAFAATCRPWHAAFSSFLSAFNLFTLFPPVLLRPPADSNLPSEFFVDPTNTAANLRCRVPWTTVSKMRYIGYSYGNLIYGHEKRCHLFDAFSGTRVKSPQLIIDKYDYPVFGALTAPLASTDSNLLVQAGCNLFQWKVGSKSWLRHCQFDLPVFQVASFKGDIFVMDSYVNLFRVQMEPSFRMQKVNAVWEEDMSNGKFFDPWLVVCDDMLLLVGPAKDSYQAVRVDLSSEPKCVKLERLENLSVFIGTETKSQAFACKNPERWGGRSNCVYFCGFDEPWGVAQLGEVVKPPPEHLERFFFGDLRDIKGRRINLPPIWVFPCVLSRIYQ